MGPLSPYISQTIGNFEILPDAKSHENYELSNDQKYPHHSDLIFCRVPFLHTFPDNILAKYSREKLSYTEVHVFS